MVDAPTESRATLYIINYLDWQREGQFTFDMQRAKLLDVLAHILDSMQKYSNDTQQGNNVLLGGETIILSDTASISENLLNSLLNYTKNGSLTVGPWYIHLDGLLANGEAYVRSLLLGRADSERYNIPANKVAFMPHNCQSVAQLPQILRGFDIDAAFICSDNAMIPLPFNWESPDSSQILVMNHQAIDQVQQSIDNQRESQPDGPFLWLQRMTSPDSTVSLELDGAIELPTLNTTLTAFTNAVRERLPDEFRPRLKGELYLQQIKQNSGRFSARISYKQDVMRLKAKLSHIADPLLALSLTFGQPKFPDIQKSLMDYSWRLLLQNMSPQTFAGAVSDDAYNEITIRNRVVDDNSQRVIDKALRGLSGMPYQAQKASSSTTETYISVWNPHGHSVKQIVELALNLPDGMYPSILLDPDNVEQAFTWDADRNIIDFHADVPSVGFAVYTLKFAKEKTAAYNQRRAVAGRSIGSASGESLGLVGGRLDWVFGNGNIIDLLNYYDGGDAGDIWQYQEPKPDVVMKASIVDVVQVEATPTYERLIFRNRMRIAPSLKDGKERVRGLRVLDLNTTATYYNDLPGVHFQTRFTNTADDHRLRVHLKTGIEASEIYTDSAFYLAKRAVAKDAATGDVPMHSLVALYDKKRGLALFTRGLSAVEPIIEDNQITLALPLLRSIGWLNKKQQISAEGAQMAGDFVTEFMLMPLDAKKNKADLLRTSMVYQAPLQAFQYNEKSDKTRHSYLTVESEHVVMTAIKAPQKGTGLLLRLLNMVSDSSDVKIKPNGKARKVSRVSLSEGHLSDVEIKQNEAALALKGHQITTLHLEF